MSRGGARPRSGPPKGTKYRPRVPKPEGTIPKPRKPRAPTVVKVKVDESLAARNFQELKGFVREAVGAPADAAPKLVKTEGNLPITVVAEASKLVKTEGNLPVDVVAEADNSKLTPIEYILAAMRDPKVSIERRDRMAALALPFTQARPDGRGKKNERDEKAKAASTGKFAPSAPPTLKAVR